MSKRSILQRMAPWCAVAVLGAMALGTTPAYAAPVVDPITDGLAGPLQLDIGHRGQIYTGESFAGRLTRINLDGSQRTLRSAPGRSITAVASDGYAVAFTVRGEDPANPVSVLRVRRANGTIRTVADLGAFEAANNPDQFANYGFRQLSASCASQVPAEMRAYTGQVDSNPYALLRTETGWFVADAGSNSILEVNRSTGQVSTYFTFPEQKITVTAEIAAAQGLPACVVGKNYAFEPVPTDVEFARDGALMATLLPGGPEDDSLGARGSIWKIPGDFEAFEVASGFLGATNLAVGRPGHLFVTEIFGNRVSEWHDGAITPVVDLPAPAGLEFVDGDLVVSYDVFGDGKVGRFTP